MPAVNISQEDIENMTNIRKAEILAHSPELKQEDFASEAEYREALLKNYQTLRQEEYQLTVRNECMKVYNLAKDGRSQGISENIGVWNGYRSYINAPRLSTAEKERRKQQVQDCAISRAPQMGSICMNGTAKSFISSNNSCAITAAAITAQVSAKMGYDGDDNLMQAKYRGQNPSFRNNLVAAQGVADCDSIPDQYKKKIEPIAKTNTQSKRKTTHTPTLNELIANGSIGVRDAFAVRTGGGSNTSTGYHALTLAAVEKDENGKITSYTLQANNGCRFSSHKMNEASYFSNKTVYNVANTHAWMEDKIKAEVQTLEHLSTAEIEAKLAEQKHKTLELADDLQKTESYAASKKYCQDISNEYVCYVTQNRSLINQTEIPEEPNQTPLPSNDNALDADRTETQTMTPVANGSSLETNKQETQDLTPIAPNKTDLKNELKTQTPSLSPAKEDPEAAFNCVRFDSKVDSRVNASANDGNSMTEGHTTTAYATSTLSGQAPKEGKDDATRTISLEALQRISSKKVTQPTNTPSKEEKPVLPFRLIKLQDQQGR